MSMCPICNGFSPLNEQCPACQHRMEDTGTIESYYGPYSPYREREHIQLTNGYPDVAMQQCIHLLHCSSCGYEHMYPVQEITNTYDL